MYKRIFALLLAFCLLMGAVPGNAFAVDIVEEHATPKGQFAKINTTAYFYVGSTPGAMEQLCGAVDFPERMVINEVDDSTGTVYYQMIAAEGYSWPISVDGSIQKLSDGVWVKADYVIILEYCDICQKYDCGVEHPAEPTDPEPSDPEVTDPSDPEPSDPEPTDPSDPDPSDPSDPVDPETPEISATVKDANGNVITDSNGNPLKVTVTGDTLPEGATLVVDVVLNEEVILNEAGIDNGFVWNIKIYDANSNTWEPGTDDEVLVTFPVPNLEDGTYVLLYHLLETKEAVSEAISNGTALYSCVSEFGSSFDEAAASAVAAYREVTGSTDDTFVVERHTPEVINGMITVQTDSFSVWLSGGVWQRYSNANDSNEVVVANNGGVTFYAPVGQTIYFDTGAGTTGSYKWRASLNGTTTDSGNLFSYNEKLLSNRTSSQARLNLSSSNVKVGDTIKVWFDGSASGIKGKTVTVIVVNEVKVTLNENRANYGNGSNTLTGTTPNASDSNQRYHIWYGSTVVSYAKPPQLSQDKGYMHTGWNTKADGTGTNVGINSNYAPTSAVTLYAQWTPIKYTIEFNPNTANAGGGTVSGSMSSINMTYDVPTTLPRCTYSNSADGYVFIGWATSPTGDVVYKDGQEIKNATTTNNGKVTLYAKWKYGLNSTVYIGINNSYHNPNGSYTAGGVTMNSYHRYPNEPAVMQADFDRVTDAKGGWTYSSASDVPLKNTAASYINGNIFNSPDYKMTYVEGENTLGVADPNGILVKNMLKFTEADYNAMIAAWLEGMRTTLISYGDTTFDWANAKAEDFVMVPYVIKFQYYETWYIDMVVTPKALYTLAYEGNIENGYTASFTGVAFPPSQQYTEGTSVPVVTTPIGYQSNGLKVTKVVDGHTYQAVFQYWYDSKGNTYGGSTGNNTIVLTENTVLYARWSYPDQSFGNLDITKTVVDRDSYANPTSGQKFTFTFTTSATGSYNYTIYNASMGVSSTGTIKNGGTFQLQHGWRIRITDIPKDATYTVKETAVNHYTASGQVTGTIEAGSTTYATVTNTFQQYAGYVVKHHVQNASGTGYTEQTADQQSAYGVVGAKTNAAAKSYSGYVAQAVTQLTIKADGTTVVNIYYDKATHGILEVEKKVTVAAGSEQPAADSFTFKITLSGSYPYTVHNAETGDQVSSGTMTDGTFILKDGQFIRFASVPVGSYTITETLPANYTNANSTQTISLKGGYTNTVIFENIYFKITIGIENGYDGKLYPEIPDSLKNNTYRWSRDTASYSYSTTNWQNQWTVVDSQYIDQNGAVDVISHEGYVHENSNTVSGTKYRYKLEVLDANGNVIAEDIFVVNFGDRILNSSFESPQTTGWLGLPNGYENLFWASTDEHETNYEVEIVLSGHEGFGGKKTTNGNQFAEINAEMSTSLYQDVVTTPGNGLTWTLGHSARVEEGTDEMFVIITSSQSAVTITGQDQVKAMIEAAKAADALDGETDVTYGDITFRIWRLESAFVDADTWTQYAGHYTVPAGQRMTRFFFAAGKTANGVETYGNLIDGVKFSETIYYVVNYYLDGELVPGASVSGSGSPAEVIAPDLDTFAKAYNAVLNADSDKTMVLSSDKANVLNLYYRSQYSVTGEINNNGKVTNAAQTVLKGDNGAQMVFTPATGYKITAITVNGQTVQVTNENSFSYTATNVTENVRVVVTTAIKTFSVTGSIDNDGTVTNPNQTVNYGDANTAMTFTPKSGYKIIGVTVNGVAVTGFTDSSYTFLQTITEDTAVVVTTAQNIFTVIWQDWDGSELGRGDWVYGTTPTFDADPDKTGNQDPVREQDAQFSYTFTGWTPAVSPVTGNATYKATYKATTRSYKVTWVDGDGKELYSTTVQYGLTPAYTGSTPTKKATAQYTYVFNGSWSPAISKVTGDVTYVAQFDSEVNSYTVTWVDGDGKVLKTEELEYGDTPVYSGSKPTKKATAEFTYTFNNKWSPAIVDVIGNATYTAQFDSEVNTYTITWVDGNGDVLKTEDLAYGDTPAYSGATPTKDPTPEFVYTFNNTWSPDIVTVTGTATYTAQFRSETRTYTVTWWIDLDDDGVMDENEILEKDTGVPFGAKPSYDQTGDPEKAPDAEWYYIFAGWSPDHNYKTVDSDLTFEAMFNPVKQQYPIYWYNFDNTTLLHKDDAVEYGTLPVYDGPAPTWNPGDGYTYTFSHWSPTISKVTGAASYYAIYNKTPIVYTITYVLNDGTVIGTAANPGTYTVESGPITLNPPVPDKPYYRFIGWTGTDLAAMTEDVTIPTGSMGNRTYTAHYERIEYTIHFDSNGGTPASVADMTYKYGDNVTLPVVTKVGYTGVWTVVSDSGNWTEGEPVVSGVMNKYGDVTLRMVWTPTTYTIRFHGNAANATGSMADMSVVYDTTVYLTANAYSRLGYSFAGWALTANGAVTYTDQAQVSNLAADGSVVDLYAVWTMNLVSLTIRTQNTVDTNQSYIYTVTGAAVDGTRIELTVAMGANDVQRIADLPAGKYTISDQQGWSWRYAHQSQEEDVYTNILVEFTYVYQEMLAAKIYWLNGYGNERIRTKSEDND